MAKVHYNKRLFERALKIDEKTIERMNALGTTVEHVSDHEIELEIPANRPDLLSMTGFLRAFKAFEGKETGLKEYKRVTTKGYTVHVDKTVKSIRPFTTCAVVEGLALTTEELEEIIALQEKLHQTIGRNRKKCAIGVYPLDKITFPVRYEARKPASITFTPLGSQKPLTADQILQKHPKGKEYANLLKNAALYPLFVDAKNNILSMPPIINSEETGHVTTETKGVFVECSGYDKHILNKTLVILVTELADRGGTIHAVRVHDQGESLTPLFEPQKIKIKKESIEKTLGIALTEKEMEKYIERMGHTYKAGTVTVPSWRTDILHEVDIAEEVAIAYGYDKLIPEIPTIATISEASPQSKLRTRLRELLNGIGLLELSSLHFITKEEVERANEKKVIEVENPRTEYRYLRPTLTLPLLRTLATNRDAEYPQQLYEIGSVFYPDNEKETGIAEEERLMIAFAPGNFTKAKQVLDYLMHAFNLSYTLTEEDVKDLIAGRAGHIKVHNTTIGYLGEVHPDTLRAWKLRMPLSLIEIKLDALLKK